MLHESEERGDTVSDIDTGVVDSLKVLDPDGRLEKRPRPTRGAREKNLTFPRIVRVQPCIRPLNAAVLAAGPDVIR